MSALLLILLKKKKCIRRNFRSGHATPSPRLGQGWEGDCPGKEGVWGCIRLGLAESMVNSEEIISEIFHKPDHCSHSWAEELRSHDLEVEN